MSKAGSILAFIGVGVILVFAKYGFEQELLLKMVRFQSDKYDNYMEKYNETNDAKYLDSCGTALYCQQFMLNVADGVWAK